MNMEEPDLSNPQRSELRETTHTNMHNDILVVSVGSSSSPASELDICLNLGMWFVLNIPF